MTRGLVIFDMDGTVVSNNSWLELHRSFGLEDGEDATMLRWYGERILTYVEWTNLITRIYRVRGRATRQRAMEAFDRCSVHLGAQDVIKKVRARGFEVALLSCGVDVIVERIARQLSIALYRANHHMVFDHKDTLVTIEVQNEENDFKIACVNEFCLEIGIPLNSCFCVGDGLNDHGIFALTGHGILLCPPESIAPFDDYWRRVGDLTEVVNAIPLSFGD